MSYTKGSDGALSPEDGATPGVLVPNSRHYRGAREAPRDFGLMSGNVTGAYVLLIQAMDIRDRLLGRNPTKRETGTQVPTDREAMAEMVGVIHVELMKVLAEISEAINNGLVQK